MKKTFCTVLIAALPLFAVAAKSPTYKEAVAVYNEIDQTVSQTGVWNKKSLQDRIAALKKAENLVAKSKRVFGDSMIGGGAECNAAAIAHQFYISNMNDLALIFEGRKRVTGSEDIYAPVYNSVSFGEHKARCLDYVDSLDAKR